MSKRKQLFKIKTLDIFSKPLVLIQEKSLKHVEMFINRVFSAEDVIIHKSKTYVRLCLAHSLVTYTCWTYYYS